MWRRRIAHADAKSMKGTRICEHYVFWGFGGVPSPIELDLLLHVLFRPIAARQGDEVCV